MTKNQLNQLQKMLESEDIKGKKLIERVIWLNTATPKYKVGDAVKVTDRALRICGEQVIKWNGKVIEIRTAMDNTFSYKVEVVYTKNGVRRTSNVYGMEDSLLPATSIESGKVFGTDPLGR